METKKIEFWISPELAEDIVDGTVMTVSVNGISKIGKGYLVEADGVFLRSGKSMPKEEPAQDTSDEIPIYDLSGSGKPIQSFVSVPEEVSEAIDVEDGDSDSNDPEQEIKEAASRTDKGEITAKDESDEPVAEGEVKNDSPDSNGISFGERGPQLIGGDDTPVEMEEDVEMESSQEKTSEKVESGPKVISDIRELYEYLKSLDPELLKESEDSGPMSRSEAVALEGIGKIGCGISAFVKNTSGSQLVLSDINVRIRHGDSYNLGRISPASLLSSTDLFEAVNSKLIEFIDGEEARDLHERTERRLAAIEEDLHSVEVYDDIDSVYDDIDGGDVDDDMDPRMRHSGANVRPQATVDNRFRRGIKSASERRRGHDYAAVETPDHFRDVEKVDVMKGRDKYEFDQIFDDMGRRDAEISSMDGDIDWKGESSTIAPETGKESRDHVKVNKRI